MRDEENGGPRVPDVSLTADAEKSDRALCYARLLAGCRSFAAAASFGASLKRADDDAAAALKHFNEAIVRVQQPVRLSRSSEPQPDVSLLRPRRDDYVKAHPGAKDTLLAIEVSETTLRYDRDIKVPLYARHGIPEVWIVDLVGEQIHFFRAPETGKYPDVSSTKEPGVVALGVLSDVTVDLTGILSP